MSPVSRLGLIAGNGVFPRLVARGARDAGVEVVAVAHVGETDPALADEVASCTWVKVGELGRIIRTLRGAGVTQVVMAGGITKVRLFGGFKPDLRGAAFLARMRTLHDDKLLRGIAEELAGEGLAVVPSTLYLPRLLPEPGILGRRALSAAQQADVNFGFRVAKAIGAFEIGQTVVVKDGLVLAIEAVEGTDAAIRRGGELSRGGAVVVKTSKPGQDLRFDVPAIGPATVRLLQEVRGTVLAVEARRTLVLEQDETIAVADAAGIVLVAVDPEPELAFAGGGGAPREGG